MTEELNLETVMSRRFELVEQIAIIQGRQKAELEPLNEEVRLCETFIKDEMNKAGMQQCKTGSGMAFFTTKDSVTVEDMDKVVHFMLAAAPIPEDLPVYPDLWEKIIAHLEAHGMWGLLNKAVNKTATKELIEANNAAPPGVKYDSYKDLAWRRGKS